MKMLTNTAQYFTEALAVLLIFRLLYLRHRENKVYVLFSAFLALQLTESLAYFACVLWKNLDYRTIWIVLTTFAIVFSPILVYFLLRAVLAEIPGVMQFAQRLFLVVFPIAVLVAFSSAHYEYGAADKHDLSIPVGRLIIFFTVAEKATSLAMVLVLVAILAFILWFPVKMPRNLAVFSIGFVVYYTAKSSLVLLTLYSTFDAVKTREIMGVISSFVVVACFVYWLIFIDSKGEEVSVRIGHSWHVSEQAKLVDRLESMNGILLRSAHRLQQ